MHDWAWEIPNTPSTPEATASISILRVYPGQTTWVIITGPWIGLSTHWTEGESRPCTGKRCRLCPDTPKRWKGYAPGVVFRRDLTLDTTRWEKTVIELTDRCRPLIEHDLAGSIVKLSRKAGKPNNPLNYEIIAPKEPLPPLPPAFDVRPVVARLYGWKPDAEPQQEDEQTTLQFPQQGTAG